MADPLSISASIIAVLQLTSKVIEYLHDVKDAPKARTQLAVEAANIYTLLVSLNCRIGDADSHEPWFDAIRDLNSLNGPLAQYRNALNQLYDKIPGDGGIKRMRFTLSWKFTKEEVGNLLLRIERLKSLIQIALEMDHFKLSQAIKDSANSIKSSIATVEQDQKRDKVLDWICSTDYLAQLAGILAFRQEGTGIWFLESPKFMNWITGSFQTLFCPGIPGAGKTVMSATAIDHLFRQVKTESIGVACVFCNYRTQAEQKISNLLSSVLRQLVQSLPLIPESVLRSYERGIRPSLKDIVDNLKSVLDNYSVTYIVVDALDECPENDGTRSQLLSSFHSLQEKTNLRLMFTSRFIPEIEDGFKAAPTLHIRASEEDVKKYVAGQTFRLPKCIQHDPELQSLVQNKIDEVADGMFLLARLHVESLFDKNTKKKVLATLAKLSRGSNALNEAYDDAVKRIDSQLPGRSELAKSVISWITCASRPLTTRELCHALAVELDETELDLDNIPDIDDVISACAGLVTIAETSDIRLVHYTTQEYFDRTLFQWNSNAQKDIASVCLTYLSFSTFKNGACTTNEGYEDRVEQNAFLVYASREWARHVKPVQELVLELALPLLLSVKSISSLVQVASCSDPARHFLDCRHYPLQITGLHLAAKNGLDYLLEKLLHASSTVKTDTNDGRGQTPLSVAAMMGHDRVVKILVDRDDVNADSVDYDGLTPLSHAARGGHEAVVELLAKRDDVNVEAKDYTGSTPLIWAARYGRDAVVKIFIERSDINPETRNYTGMTPLLCAAEFESVEVVKLLVEQAGVKPNLEDYNGRTPLMLAVMMRSKAIAEFLIGRDDVNINAEDGRGRNVLFYAVTNWNDGIVELLLENGVNVQAESLSAIEGNKHKVRLLLEKDTRGISNIFTLNTVAKYGSQKMVQLLIENGAQVDEGTLIEAIHNDDEEVAKLLLEKGARADSKALYAAAEEGHLGLLHIFLDQRKSAMELQSEDMNKALTYAVFNSQLEVAKVLIARDAEVELSAVLHAVCNGEKDMIHLLLERKEFDINERDEDGQSLLSHAARNGQREMVKLLVERGAKGSFEDIVDAADKGEFGLLKLLIQQDDIDLNFRGGVYNESPLSLALGWDPPQEAEGEEEGAKLLLERGAKVGLLELNAAARWGRLEFLKLLSNPKDLDFDLNAPEEIYGNRTALQNAVLGRHKEVVELLIEWGAKVDMKAMEIAEEEENEQVLKLLKSTRAGEQIE